MIFSPLRTCYIDLFLLSNVNLREFDFIKQIISAKETLPNGFTR